MKNRCDPIAFLKNSKKYTFFVRSEKLDDNKSIEKQAGDEMTKIKKWNHKSTSIFVVYVFLTILLINLLFMEYRAKLNQEFDQLVEMNLTAYAESQKREAETTIKDVEGTLDAIATMLDTSGMGPEEEWVTEYLEALSQRKSKYEVTYIPMETLYNTLGTPGSIEEDYQTYDRLMNGEHVISDIRLSKRLGNRVFFSIAVPVKRDGRVVGVPRSLLKGTVLVQTIQTGSFSDSVQSYVVKSDGSFVVVRDSNAGADGNLFDKLAQYKACSVSEKEVRKAVENNESITYRMNAEDGSSFFLSVTNLGYNDWHIVNFTQASDVTEHSTMIMRDTVMTSVGLMLLAAATGCIIFWVFRRQKERLLLEQVRYATLANFSDTALFEYSYREHVLSFTSNARKLLPIEYLSYEKNDFQKLLTLVHPDDKKIVTSEVKVLPARDEIKNQEVRMCNAAGEYFWCECQYQVLYDEHDQPIMIVGRLNDISERKERERGLIKRSETDPLTGIYNRSAVEHRIRGRLEQPNPSGFFLMIDIDNFKQVNDRNGHAAGDQILRKIAQILSRAFREGDLLGRVGGDEFIAFVGTRDQNAMEKRIVVLLKDIAALCLENGECAGVSCSIGIATCPEDGCSYRSLFKTADHMMYLAKKSGKNAYRFSR